jgi:putative heme-binding domain-containing protein
MSNLYCPALISSPRTLPMRWAMSLVLALTLETTLLAQFTVADNSPRRIPWTTSRIQGTPEPPHPYLLVPAFPNLRFSDPMQVRWSPALKRYFVCELQGKIWSFAPEEDVASADLVVDLKREIKSFDPARSNGLHETYSIALDPDFASNRFIYVCMIFSSKSGKPLDDGTRISRFQVLGDHRPKIDPQSELPIIEWIAGGHNGCDLLFDPSGCLLISTGDATEPSPPDRLKTGQDISDLLSSILRIDVRNASREQPYTIPKDNPFLDVPNARKEVWAFGFRNPWRITLDRATDRLIVGDVGWEKWEMIHRVERGGNYGWSVREGNELHRGDIPLGPAPITPPWVALSHTESASITGGMVYRGRQFDSLSGHYLFGDWVHGRVWAIPLDRSEPQREIASSTLRIVAFEPDANEEPLVVSHLYQTPLYRLVDNPKYMEQQRASQEFPRLLSDTGIFQSAPQQLPAEGVIGFSVNHPMWQDGATSQYHLGLPNDSRVTVFDSPQPLANMAMFNSRLHYPAGTILAKTIRWKEVLLETQVLHFDGSRWHGYSYAWNKEQTDAELAPREGTELVVESEPGKRWRIPGRNECFQCHNPWSETTLAFTPEQLHSDALGDESPWIRLHHDGWIAAKNSKGESIGPQVCVRVPLQQEESASVEDRARSYLHANCAHCHQFGAGTGVAISLRRSDAMEESKTMSLMPEKGSFGFSDAKIIDPGNPSNSVLLYRMASSSVGRMPHIGSREVDFAAVSLIAQWIEQISPTSPNASASRLPHAETEEAGDAESKRRTAFRTAIEAAKRGAPLDSATVERLTSDSDAVISSLFEAFLPEQQRVRRLQAGARFTDIEDRVGDPNRGSELFREQGRLQCSRCHEVGGNGGAIGPSLASIGRSQSKSQLFESIAEPSRQIDPKYQTHRIRTQDGEAIAGLLVSESDGMLQLVVSSGEKINVPPSEISEHQLESTSLMPAGLLEQLTAQEMADLLAYLATLR